jgi:hypothetical protein
MGAVLTVMGSAIRWFAALGRSDLSSGGVYGLLMFGSSLGALAQPLLFNLPAVIASVWFPMEERDLATTVASLFNAIGNAIGQVFPVLFVTQDAASGAVHGMAELLLMETVMCLVAAGLCIGCFRSAPPSPPSASAELRHEVPMPFVCLYLLACLCVVVSGLH